MAMIPQPPIRLSLSEVVAYVLEKHAATITRRTPFNWAKVGRKGIRLKTCQGRMNHAGRPTLAYTTSAWVDEFLADAQPRFR